MKRSATIGARPRAMSGVWPLLRALVIRGSGALLLFVLLYQIPASHVVDVGYNDAAYVQGFNDPVNRWGVIDPSSDATTPLRWSTDRSYLVFPQIGLPAEATIRWRNPAASQASPTRVQVLLNGRDELGVFPVADLWETQSFQIEGGLLKANDLFLELRVEPAEHDAGVVRGLQVDRVSLRTVGWPIMPYPAQLVYGCAAVVLGTALVRGRRQQLLAALGIGLAFLLLYRLPVTGYPLRSLLPSLVVVLGIGVGVAQLPHVAGTLRRYLWLMVAAGVAVWCGWLLATARQHVALSVPGVERDFPVFATRASALFCDRGQPPPTGSCVLRADGFYQLGYPMLLWLVQPLADGNAFFAARWIAALSAGLLLAATAALGWRFGSASARGTSTLLAVAILGLSPLTVQYGLYVGTDMPFAAAWSLGLAALLVPHRHSAWSLVLAGALCAVAFLIRHPGLVLLPFGWVTVWLLQPKDGAGQQTAAVTRKLPWWLIAWFTLGWLCAALPQLAINVADTGNPLYSQQAKNIWLAVYGNTDYSGRWNDATNEVGLVDIVLADPWRFFGNWGRNLVAFVGSGAEDTSEFGQALGLRLLGAPANWLAMLGLGLWLWRGDRRTRLLVAAAVLYVAGVSVGFVLPRFFLPLAPIWAVAAAGSAVMLAGAAARRWPRLTRAQWLALVAAVLIVAMADGPRIGARYVLERQRPGPGAFTPEQPFPTIST